MKEKLKEQELPEEEALLTTYAELLETARGLPVKWQLKLVEAIVAGLQQSVEDPPVKEESSFTQTKVEAENQESPLHDIMEYEGFAKHVWQGIDVEQYLNEERNSWDG